MQETGDFDVTAIKIVKCLSIKEKLTKMIVPVRCFTCGGLIADKWDDFHKRTEDGDNPDKILDDLGVKRWCCRRMLISHIDLIDEFLPFT